MKKGGAFPKNSSVGAAEATGSLVILLWGWARIVFPTAWFDISNLSEREISSVARGGAGGEATENRSVWPPLEGAAANEPGSSDLDLSTEAEHPLAQSSSSALSAGDLEHEADGSSGAPLEAFVTPITGNMTIPDIVTLANIWGSPDTLAEFQAIFASAHGASFDAEDINVIAVRALAEQVLVAIRAHPDNEMLIQNLGKTLAKMHNSALNRAL